MSEALAIPLTIVSQETASMISAICAEAMALKISSPEDFSKGMEALNQLGRMRKAVKDAEAEKRKPFNAILDGISAMRESILVPIKAAETATSAELKVYDTIQKAEQAKAEQERRKLSDEAMRKQREVEAAIQLAKDETSFQQAAQVFDQVIAKQEQAEAVYIPPVLKTKGIKTQRTAVIESVDLAKLPLSFHMADDAKIKKAILAGFIDAETPGVKWRIDESFVGSGR
jgi:hypothetical protein